MAAPKKTLHRTHRFARGLSISMGIHLLQVVNLLAHLSHALKRDTQEDFFNLRFRA